MWPGYLLDMSQKPMSMPPQSTASITSARERGREKTTFPDIRPRFQLPLTVDPLGDGGVAVVVVRIVQVVVVAAAVVTVVPAAVVTVDHVVRVGLGGVDVGRAAAESVAGVEKPRLLR